MSGSKSGDKANNPIPIYLLEPHEVDIQKSKLRVKSTHFLKTKVMFKNDCGMYNNNCLTGRFNSRKEFFEASNGPCSVLEEPGASGLR